MWLYAGASIEGAVMAKREGMNEAYDSKKVRLL